MSRSPSKSLIRLATLLTLLILSIGETFCIPAFARKTGLRCTACHESWPVLNDFGRAYRDNGYQLRLGRDEPTKTDPTYWPIALRATPSYQYNTLTNQETDQGKKDFKTGGVAEIEMDLLTMGALSDRAAFNVIVAGFSSEESAGLESYWVYFPRLIRQSDWLNVRFGKYELDLPLSGHRSINLTNPYLVYSYHPSADVDAAGPLDLSENQRGLEIVGHNRGSLTRYSVSLFDGNDSTGSRGALDSPSVYAHFQQYWQRDSRAVPEFEVGVFATQARYPTTSYTLGGEPIPGEGGDLKSSSRFGAEFQVWFGSLSSPLHLTLVYARGKDDRDLYAGADQDGSWKGGFLEAIWVLPRDLLHWSLFARYDGIRNSQQPFLATPKEFGDQDQVTGGFKYTIQYSNRDEFALHAEYSTNSTREAAFDGTDVESGTTFVGIDFAF